MEVLSTKKRRKGLAYTPAELDADEISDDEYPSIVPAEDLQDKKLLKQYLKRLFEDYYTKATGDESEMSLPRKRKRLDWLEHQAIRGGAIELPEEELNDDFKRELHIYNNTLNNTVRALEIF